VSGAFDPSTLGDVGRAVAGASWMVAALGLLAAALLVPFRRLPPAWKAWIWWLVAARAILELAGAPALELRILPPESSAAIALRGVEGTATQSAALAPRAPDPGAIASAPADASPAAGAARFEPWRIGGALYLAGLLLFVAHSTRRWWQLRALVARARPAAEPAITAALARVGRVPRGKPVTVVRSAEVDSPRVVGLLRPTVVLPAAQLSTAELDLVLAHECEHIARRDGWRALVPEIARHLFYFHPVVRLAVREFVLAVEAACDAAVLSRRVGPADRYGRLLVRFAADRPALAAAAGSWPLAASSIQRRLEMLLFRKLDRRTLFLVAPPALVLAALVAVPVRLAAQPDAPPAPPAPAASASPVSDEALPAAPAPPALPAGTRWSAAAPPALPATPAVAAVSPVGLAPLAPLAPMPPEEEIEAADWFIFLDGDTSWYWDAPKAEQRRARELAAANGDAILLAGRDGAVFVARDRATLDRVAKRLAEHAAKSRAESREMREKALAERQEVREQSRLLKAELAEQLESRSRSDEISARRLERMSQLEAERLARLNEELAALGTSELAIDQEALARSLAEAQAQLSQLSAQLSRLGEQLGSDREAELDRIRQKLDRQRAENATQREEMAAAREKLRAELERERSERRRELDAMLQELFDDGSLAPIDRR